MVEENLHLSVLRKAFEEVKSSKDTLTVNNFTIHRGLLLLFSPFIADLLASIPESNPIITIPDTALFDLVNVSELLLHGTCSNVKSTSEARNLFITLRTLGIDVQRLESRSDGSEEEAVINVALAGAADLNQHQGRKVVFTYDLPNDDETSTEQSNDSPNSTEQQTANPSSPLPPPQPIEIKKEAEVAEPHISQDQAFSIPQQDSETNAPMETEAVTPQEPKEKDEEMKQITEKDKTNGMKLEINQCKKCQKLFPTLIMLKNHYCGHFLSIIKKKFQSSYSDLNCLEKTCNKKFPSLQKLLVHIGVVHDKINAILKMKGIEELPPYQIPTQNTKPQDVKNEPHNKPTSKPVTPTTKQKANVTPEQPVATPKPANKAPLLAPPVTPQTPAMKTAEVDSLTSVAQTPSEKKSLDKECNFTQECQVCKQKMTSLHLLEQHLCRHFMKEIADTYKDLQDDLKCTLCASVFKQKHSLVLHIGCKHGKINEILKSKNFPVLPAPILSHPTSAMQKQLQKVKKERFEQSESETPVKQTNANVLSKPSPVDALLSAQTLLQPTSASSGSSVPSLDDILKKYNMNISTSK